MKLLYSTQSLSESNEGSMSRICINVRAKGSSVLTRLRSSDVKIYANWEAKNGRILQ